jgi:hypothetical protein
MPWSVYNSTGKLLQSLAIGDDSIVEGKLDVSNAPTNGYFLQAQSGEGGGLTWAAAGGDLSFGGDTFGANKVIGANDAYSLSLETSGNTALTIAATGEVTMPLQPAVFAFNASNENNLTGNGTAATARLNTEVYDQNADFASNTFTAPVTGRYHISACLAVSGMTTSATAFLVQLVTSNRTFVPVQGGSVPANGSYHWPLSVDADMDVNDTVYMRFYVYGMGSDTVDIRGDGSEVETFMAVRLVA